jgi:hypothetical protein
MYPLAPVSSTRGVFEDVFALVVMTDSAECDPQSC